MDERPQPSLARRYYCPLLNSYIKEGDEISIRARILHLDTDRKTVTLAIDNKAYVEMSLAEVGIHPTRDIGDEGTR